MASTSHPPPTSSGPSSTSSHSSTSASSSSSHSHSHSSPPTQDTPHNHVPHAPPAPHYATHPIFAPHSRMTAAAPPRIPEKCLSWCSQRDGAPAMCRMLCLRRRPALPTQNEALAKLRPPSRDGEEALHGAFGREDGREKKGEDMGFFEAWRAKLAPYSFIYVKGTPEGVVGRYMEELDADDGQYDFGPVSRHAPHTIRRKSDGNIEYFDWGEAGFLLHVPLTSLFSPFLNIPKNVERVLGPPRNLATQYYESFENGTQARALGRFTEEVYKLGAFDMAGRVWGHWRTKYEQNAEAEAAAEREAARERGGVKDSVGKNAKE